MSALQRDEETSVDGNRGRNSMGLQTVKVKQLPGSHFGWVDAVLDPGRAALVVESHNWPCGRN